MRRTSAPRCGCRTTSTVSPCLTARLPIATVAARPVDRAARNGAEAPAGCDELHLAIHSPESPQNLDLLNKTAEAGFPPVALASQAPPCKRDERSRRTPVPMPPGRGFFIVHRAALPRLPCA